MDCTKKKNLPVRTLENLKEGKGPCRRETLRDPGRQGQKEQHGFCETKKKSRGES